MELKDPTHPQAHPRYFCDITGKELWQGIVPMSLTLSCGYGSMNDGNKYTFHFSSEVEPLIMHLLNQAIIDPTTWDSALSHSEFGPHHEGTILGELSEHEKLSILTILSSLRAKAATNFAKAQYTAFDPGI